MLKEGGKYYINYNGHECKFIPKIREKDNWKDKISGKVIYIESGAYNPSSWYREVTIQRENIKMK